MADAIEVEKVSYRLASCFDYGATGMLAGIVTQANSALCRNIRAVTVNGDHVSALLLVCTERWTSKWGKNSNLRRFCPDRLPGNRLPAHVIWYLCNIEPKGQLTVEARDLIKVNAVKLPRELLARRF